MTLKGTLRDLGIVDLLQFPHSGRRSGRLLVEENEQSAVVYYHEGAIVHAQLGEHQGIEAIIRLLDWTTGLFSFETDSKTDERTIDEDLHRVMMKALKIRDERAAEAARLKEEKQRQAEEERLRSQGFDPALTKLLMGHFPNTSLSFVAVLNGKGEITARAGHTAEDTDFDGLQEIVLAFHTFHNEMPRPGLSKVVLQDREGTIVYHVLSGGRAVLGVGKPKVPLGGVSMAASRIASSVEDKSK